MVKETKKTRNKGKIKIVLRKGTAILLALIMVLTVGVTNAKAETAGPVYGKANVETSSLENGCKKVIYQFYELNSEQNPVLTTKVTETLEPSSVTTGAAIYVLTDRVTETYENGDLTQKTDDDFMSGLSVKTASTVYDASGNVIRTETVAAEPTSETDYLGQTHYTATFTASPAAITAGKVITTLNGKGGLVEKDGLVEKEYDNSGKLVRIITRDADCNILRYEIIDNSTTAETISYKDALTGDKAREITTETVGYEGDRVQVKETIYDNNVEIWYIDTTYIGENYIIKTRTTLKKQGPGTTFSETQESFDAQGKLTTIEEKEYETENNENNRNYTSKTYNGTGTLICETTYKENPSDGIESCKTEVYKDASGNTTKKTISTVNSDSTQIILEWYYENNALKYGVETKKDNSGTVTSERHIDPKGNEIDKPVTVTVSLSETTFTYSGADIKPDVTVKTGEVEINSTEYTVTYENNTEVGTAMVKVSDVFGGTYKVDGSATFEITRASISPTVEMGDMMVGSAASQPVISGNPGNGAVTIAYKVKDADDATYTDKVPQTAGRYTVRVSIAETKNYKAGTATADFSVKAPEQPPVTDPDEGNTSGSGSGTSSGTEGETTSGTEGETTSGTEGGTTSGTEGETTSGTEGGTTSGTEGGTTSGTEGETTSGTEGETTPGTEGETTPGTEGGTTSGTEGETTSGTEGETTPGTEGETTPGTEGGTTSGTEGGTTSGTTSGTESGNASGETPDSEKDKEVKEENSGSVTVREEKTNEDGSTSVKEETVNADGSTYVKEETVNADGSTVVKEETTEADGSTVVKEETKDASGAGSATEVVSDAEGNVLRTTEETTTVSKKGTVTLKALTKNADDSTVEKTQKQYRADEEGTVKTVTNLTATKADGSVVKTKETMLVDAQGNTTAVSKKTATTEDGKKEVTTTSAQLDAKGKGVIVSETKVGKETTASETYALSSKGTAKVTKLESADATVVVPETLEIAGKEVPVTSISKNAMKNNKKITAVEIGENITTVGAGAFKGSKNLSNISITASITKISKNAFAGIAPNAVFKIRGTKKDFERIVALLKESGVADTVTFELDKS